MKYTYAFILFSLTTAIVVAQDEKTGMDYASFFNEIREAAHKGYPFWDKDLYSAILLVDPQTREVIANEADSTGILKKDGDLYVGSLPEDVSIANTATRWAGKDWAMIILPLPEDKYQRIGLLAHELFHKAQPSLGFEPSNSQNNHLDEKKGRIYLRLELEALKTAVLSSSKTELHQHLTNALTFRKYRHQIYPGSDTTENVMELHEGLAEYTGFMISNRSKKTAIEYFVKRINDYQATPTFVRSFAYQTVPVYGYLLSNQQENWNKAITNESNLTTYFINAFQISQPVDLKNAAESISGTYHGEQIFSEETKREEETKKLKAIYKQKFIDQPHFEIYFEQMSLSFDPRNIIPLGDKGTVYPYIHVIDNWGTLIVEKGALMSPEWDKISITNPTDIDGNKVSGNGWTLNLAEGYILIKSDNDKNYTLSKK